MLCVDEYIRLQYPALHVVNLQSTRHTFGRELLHDIVHAQVHVVEAVAALAHIQSREDGKQGFPDVVYVQDDAPGSDPLVHTIAIDALKHHACSQWLPTEAVGAHPDQTCMDFFPVARQ